jgi:hypothetical protein
VAAAEAKNCADSLQSRQQIVRYNKWILRWKPPLCKNKIHFANAGGGGVHEKEAEPPVLNASLAQ